MDHNPSASPYASTHEQAFIPTLVSDKLDTEFWHGERRPRHDGWSPAKLREFIVRLSQCGVVADAAKFVGMSAQSAYAYRNRAEGRAFHLAWEAALVHAHRRLADELLSRAMNGVVERIERNGVVTQRHRYDSRLSMAVLTRLDRVTAEARKEGSAVHAVAGELDQLLDIIGGGAEPVPAVPDSGAAPPPTGHASIM